MPQCAPVNPDRGTVHGNPFIRTPPFELFRRPVFHLDKANPLSTWSSQVEQLADIDCAAGRVRKAETVRHALVLSMEVVRTCALARKIDRSVRLEWFCQRVSTARRLPWTSHSSVSRAARDQCQPRRATADPWPRQTLHTCRTRQGSSLVEWPGGAALAATWECPCGRQSRAIKAP